MHVCLSFLLYDLLSEAAFWISSFDHGWWTIIGPSGPATSTMKLWKSPLSLDDGSLASGLCLIPYVDPFRVFSLSFLQTFFDWSYHLVLEHWKNPLLESHALCSIIQPLSAPFAMSVHCDSHYLPLWKQPDHLSAQGGSPSSPYMNLTTCISPWVLFTPQTDWKRQLGSWILFGIRLWTGICWVSVLEQMWLRGLLNS